MRNTIFAAMLMFVLLSCTEKNSGAEGACNIAAASEAGKAKLTITQGVHGNVFFTEGNCMPGIGMNTSCRTCPVTRKVRFYEPALLGDATPATNITNGFFKSMNTRLVAETTSDVDGFYQVNLPAGTYSMVVVEDDLLYANSFQSNGAINPVVVGSGLTKADLSITYKAVY